MFPCVRQLSSPSWGPRSRWTAKTCRKCVVSFELLNCSNQCTYIHLYIYICIYNHVYCIRSYDLVWFRMIYVCLISYVWMDACMVWYGMAWHGMAWYGMVCYVIYVCYHIPWYNGPAYEGNHLRSSRLAGHKLWCSFAPNVVLFKSKEYLYTYIPCIYTISIVSL